MDGTDMCGKSPSQKSGYMGLCENIYFQQFCLLLTFSDILLLLS